MKLPLLKTKILEDTTPGTLDTEIQTFVLAHPSATFVSIHYQATYQVTPNNVLYSALLAYTE